MHFWTSLNGFWWNGERFLLQLKPVFRNIFKLIHEMSSIKQSRLETWERDLNPATTKSSLASIFMRQRLREDCRRQLENWASKCLPAASRLMLSNFYRKHLSFVLCLSRGKVFLSSPIFTPQSTMWGKRHTTAVVGSSKLERKRCLWIYKLLFSHLCHVNGSLMNAIN